MPEGGFDFDAARRENEALLLKTITEVHRPAGGRPALGSAPLCIGCPACLLYTSQVDNLAGNYADLVFSYSTQGTLLVRTTRDSQWTKLTGSVV